MNGCFHFYKKNIGLVLLIIAFAVTQLNAQQGQKTIGVKQPNLSSFSLNNQHGLKGVSHEPNMVEVVARRTATSRYFTDRDTAGKFYSIQSLGAINYYKNGAWHVIDTKLKPNSNGTYTAPDQQEPVGFDIKKKASFIESKNQRIYFNQWELYGEKNGSLTLLATANWQQFSAGEHGLHISQIFPGIDAEMLVQKGAVKTNFIVSKNDFPQYGQLVFKDRFDDAANTGRFLQNKLSLQTQPTEFVSGGSKLTIEPAYMYAEGQAPESYSNLSATATKNEFSFTVAASYLTKYLASSRVIIDPLVSSEDSIKLASITGSKNCGSSTNTCDYMLSVNTPAKATLTGVALQFAFEGIVDAKEAGFILETGNCSSGDIGTNESGPGVVSTNGNWFPVTQELLPCLPAPSCVPQAVQFKFRFYNTNCTGVAGCSNTFAKAVKPLQILIQGRTLENSSTTASATNICAGTPSTLTTVGIYGVPPYSYSWNNNAGTSSTATVSPTATTTYTATITDQCGTTATGTATVVIKPIPVIASATTNSPVCEGSTLQINTAAIAGATLAWTGPNGFTSTNATNSIASATTAASGIYTVTATQNGCTSAPVTATAVVDAVAAPTVNIAASATTVCAGTNVTFTATATNAGAAPTYQWKINGINAGTNSNTFISNTLANGSVITVIATSSAVCSTTPTATSNAITMVVNPVVTPSVSITASATNVCAGSPVNFTATAVNGGTALTYQWKLNGANVGSNSNQYSNSNLANGDIVTCEITGNAACATVATAVSNGITIAVNPLVTSTIGITASNTAVCINTTVNFAAAVTNAGNQPTYQWKLNGNNVGTNANTYSNNALAANDQITCQLTPTTSCPASATVLSNVITMDVSVPVTPAVTISVADTNVCLGVNTTFTASITNGGTTPIYQWKLNGGNVGTNSATYSTTTLKTGDKISVVITSNATCATVPTATSNTLTIKVNTVVSPTISITASSTEICAGASVSFTAITTDEGNSPVFDWLINGLITNGDSRNFTTNNLTDGASVTAVLSPQGIGCLASSTVVSNAVVVKVDATPVVNAGNDTMIFRGTGFRLNGQATGTIASYEWTPGTYLSSSTVRNPTTFPVETITYTLKATSTADCSSSDTLRIKVLTRIEVPNAFSPNGDGINDIWNIVGLIDYEGATLEVFDRYGQQILKSSGYNKPWDGTKNGKPLPVATYYYIITPQNGLQPITGSVTIIR